MKKKFINLFILFLPFLLISCGGSNTTPQPPVTHELISINVESLPNKVKYYLNEDFTSDGLRVDAKYSDNTSENITSLCDLSKPDMTTTGIKPVNVTYLTKMTSFNIQVVDRPYQYEGDGSIKKPYTVKDAIELIKTLPDGQSSNTYYFKGNVKNVVKQGTSKDLQLYIKDDFGNSLFIYYLKKYADTSDYNWESINDLHENDALVVVGNVKLFNGTNQINSGAYVYTINGVQPQKPVIEELKIKDVRKKCLNLQLPDSNPKIAFDTLTKVTVKGRAFDNLDAITTKSGYGPRGKTMLMDETGYIYVASDSTNAQSFYSKARFGTYYEVTGYISNNQGEAEIILQNFNILSDFTCDCEKYINENAKVFDDLESYYLDTYSTISYNCKGIGFGGIVKINNVTSIGRSDKASTGKFVFADQSSHCIDVLYQSNTNAFSDNTVYNLVGIQNIYMYNASLRVISHSRGDQTKIFDYDNFVSRNVTIKSIFDNISFKDDTYNKVSETYFKNKMDIYSVSAYVSFYKEGSKYYITLCDSIISPSSKNDAYKKYAVTINNDSCWDVSESRIQYCPLYDYINSGEPVTLYFTLCQENHINIDPIKNKACWKVYLFEEMVPLFPEFDGCKEASINCNNSTYNSSLSQVGDHQCFQNGDVNILNSKNGSSKYTTRATNNYDFLRCGVDTKLEINLVNKFDVKIYGAIFTCNSYHSIDSTDKNFEVYSVDNKTVTFICINPSDTFLLNKIEEYNGTTCADILSVTIFYKESSI
ncbi:MAG: OB-fold nucleic acid binding domain-containing protein [Bacilli bacterium]|nr:OB-fold nucleic acid binding domain-containing protein [Bacilli bacterium]